VALSAVLDDETALARWLNCRLIKESTRPVDLLQGIAVAGNFHYRSFNTGIEGDEAFPLQPDREGLTASLLEFIRDVPPPQLGFKFNPKPRFWKMGKISREKLAAGMTKKMKLSANALKKARPIIVISRNRI
jgi:hypothetical protein